jgi:hypothetical protein
MMSRRALLGLVQDQGDEKMTSLSPMYSSIDVWLSDSASYIA